MRKPCTAWASPSSKKGRLDDAIASFQEALKINPEYAEAHSNLGAALQAKGEAGEAASEHRKAIEIKPDDVAAGNNLAYLLATRGHAQQRDGARAVELARRVNGLTGGHNPVILGTLAAAYAEAGRFPDAVETARQAIIHLLKPRAMPGWPGRFGSASVAIPIGRTLRDK